MRLGLKVVVRAGWCITSHIVVLLLGVYRHGQRASRATKHFCKGFPSEVLYEVLLFELYLYFPYAPAHYSGGLFAAAIVARCKSQILHMVLASTCVQYSSHSNSSNKYNSRPDGRSVLLLYAGSRSPRLLGCRSQCRGTMYEGTAALL